MITTKRALRAHIDKTVKHAEWARPLIFRDFLTDHSMWFGVEETKVSDYASGWLAGWIARNKETGKVTT